MSRLDKTKTLMQANKIQRELKKQVIRVEKGDGAVVVEMNGEQKLKKIHIDPSFVDLEDIEQLERWLEDAIRDAVNQSQRFAAEKMQPIMGSLGSLGL
jgi:DNA-binding YbaB/EbfC family protein